MNYIPVLTITLTVLAILITLLDHSILRSLPPLPVPLKLTRLVAMIVMWAGVIVMWVLQNYII